MDVAFVGHTAYVLVTLVGPAFGQPDVVNGIYRIEKDGSATAIADVGAWSIAHPPATDFFVPSGVQYALQKFRGGLLVTDGHHNRVLRVSRHGDIRQLAAFGNIVPTGLEVHGRTIFMGEAGPIPHLPENGKVVRFTPRSPATEVASGASLIVDVEFGRCRELYALSQGVWDLPPTPENEGKPASPDTGRLLRVERGRQLRVRRRRPGPADVARVHRRHGVRRHAHRQGPPDRRREPAARQYAFLIWRDVPERSVWWRARVGGPVVVCGEGWSSGLPGPTSRGTRRATAMVS